MVFAMRFLYAKPNFFAKSLQAQARKFLHRIATTPLQTMDFAMIPHKAPLRSKGIDL